MNKVEKFLEELEQLSIKHGLWIEENEKNGRLDLVDNNIETIAADLHFDGESQVYKVNMR